MSGRIELIDTNGLVFATVSHSIETDNAMRLITWQSPDNIEGKDNGYCMSWLDEYENVVVQLHTPVSWIDTLLHVVDKRSTTNNDELM